MRRSEIERCTRAREELERSVARLKDLEERGDEACSAYDLHYGYDAEFNKRLVGNHVRYFTAELETCPKELFTAPEATPERSTHSAPPKEKKEPIAKQATLFEM